jgi:hypothetical protein
MTRARKAWNGGTVASAMAEAQRRADAAIASGCPRCIGCGGDGGMPRPAVAAAPGEGGGA